MERELKIEKIKRYGQIGEASGIIVAPGKERISLDVYHCIVRHEGLFRSMSYGFPPGTDENDPEVKALCDEMFKACELSIQKAKSDEFRSQNIV